MPLRRVTVNVARQTRAACDSSARARKICATYKDDTCKIYRHTHDLCRTHVRICESYVFFGKHESVDADFPP